MDLEPTLADRLGEELAELGDDRGRLSLSREFYLRPDVHEFEVEHIFESSWQYFAPAAALSNVGDVVTGMIGRTPVVVTRDEHGLNAMVNICQHRAYTVATEDRNCSRLQCGYHGWIYDLDGSLASTGAETRPYGDLSLRRVSVEQWAQAIFVHLDPGASVFQAHHAGLSDAAATRGFDTAVGRYVPYRTIVTEQQANWKLWYDNGGECYHCAHVHGSSFNAAYGGAHQWDTNETWSNSFGFEDDSPKAAAGSVLTSSRFCSFQFFPGCQMIQQEDMMVIGRIIPTGPSSSTFVANYLAEVGADPERVDQWIALWDQTYIEDARAIEVQQRNIASGRVGRMRYVDGVEGLTSFFSRLICDAYAAGIGSQH